MGHTLLLVDDEENILKALRRLLHRLGHEILTAGNAADALRILEGRAVSLILSDHRMPGRSGAELLREAAELQPEAVRIMLTGYADMQAAMQAINEGRVYRFLAKPWDDAGLLGAVADALAELDLRREHADLQERVRRQNAELKKLNTGLERRVEARTAELAEALGRSEELVESLRQQNVATVKAFAGILDLRSQPLGAHCRRVAGWVQPVCARLGVGDPRQVQRTLIAALLHDLGKVSLPDAILVKDPAHLGSAEREEVMRHPVLGQGQVQVVEGLAEVARSIRHHHENLDGSGYPDGLAADAIPLGARVIRVLDAYDNLTRGGARRGAEERLALEIMDREVGRHFDGAVFTALLDVLDRRADAYDACREAKVPLSELREGMVLCRDLRTRSGILLVPRDEPLKQSYLEKIRNFSAIYPTDSYAYVVRKDPRP